MARRSIVVTLLTLLVLLPAVPRALAADSVLAVTTLGTRPNLVTDGDALLAVRVTAALLDGALRVSVTGPGGVTRDVTGSFVRTSLTQYVGLVTGMAPGTNVVRVWTALQTTYSLELVNHDRRGPVISGPQIQPWTCAIPSTDPQCDAPTTFAYFYVSSDGSKGYAFLPYDPANPPPPADVWTTTTDQGRTVPFIVRQETGVMDRGVYQAAVLFDPAQSFTPTAPQPAWNHKMMTIGGSGCGTKHGASPSIDVMDRDIIGKGFIVASSGLLNNGQNCNIAVQAEALMMLREHIVDAYGTVRYNIGRGCSGGSITMQQVANAYPGLIDGIVVQCSYPDSFSPVTETYDCALLLDYWNAATTRGVAWTPDQKAAVTGHESELVCRFWVEAYAFHRLYDPHDAGAGSQQNCVLPAGTGFDETTNPTGVRCSVQDYMVNVFGRRASDGYANRPADNVGVLYGYNAYRVGHINAEQFVDLNTAIGSYDINFRKQPGRAAADLAALDRVYRSGAMNEANNLGDVPIVDMRGHTTEDIHTDVWTYATRARLDRAFGNHANHVVLVGPGMAPATPNGDNSFPARGPDMVDRWLTAVEQDVRSVSRRQKVIEDKPADAVDTCYHGFGDAMPDQSLCPWLFTPTTNPRQAAGEGPASDKLKCTLKPLNRSEFPVPFNDDQWARLAAAFPEGVCDYSRLGVSQQGAVPWLSYADGPGGVPVG
jgi:hypothetical protein